MKDRWRIRGPIFTSWYEPVALVVGFAVGAGLAVWAVVK